MKRKYVLPIIFGVFLSCLITSCNRYDAKTVFWLPKGFVSLNMNTDNNEDILRYIFWESQISFMDCDNNCIYHTSVNNDKFIVKYKGEYYIDNTIYKGIEEKAKTNAEKRNK